jgi:hypothetical protein
MLKTNGRLPKLNVTSWCALAKPTLGRKTSSPLSSSSADLYSAASSGVNVNAGPVHHHHCRHFSVENISVLLVSIPQNPKNV